MDARRNPDTVFLLGLLLLGGIGQLISGAESGTVEELVPSWVLYAWSVTLIVGAAASLAGVLWRASLTGLQLEAVGRCMFGPAAFAYAWAIAAVGGTRGALVVAILVGLGVASLWRIVQIRRRLLGIRSSLAAMTEGQTP